MKSPVSKSTMKTIGKKTNIKSIAPTLSAACVVIKINLPKINKNNINNINNRFKRKQQQQLYHQQQYLPYSTNQSTP